MEDHGGTLNDWLDQPMVHIVALSRWKSRQAHRERVEQALVEGKARQRAQLDRMQGMS